MKDEELEEEFDEEVEANEESTETNTKANKKPNVSKSFIDTIQAYLNGYAVEDKVFAERYSNPDKNIEECCSYILNQVRKSGCMGFADAEIFKMARDYYVDEIDEKDLKAQSCTVVVNHQVELTEEEKKQAHDDAVKQYQSEELKKLREKQKKEENKLKEAAKKEQEAKQKKIEKTGIEQLSLF